MNSDVKNAISAGSLDDLRQLHAEGVDLLIGDIFETPLLSAMRQEPINGPIVAYLLSLGAYR